MSIVKYRSFANIYTIILYLFAYSIEEEESVQSALEGGPLWRLTPSEIIYFDTNESFWVKEMELKQH